VGGSLRGAGLQNLDGGGVKPTACSHQQLAASAGDLRVASQPARP